MQPLHPMPIANDNAGKQNRVQELEWRRYLKPGQRVFVHGGAATPNALLRSLVREGDTLRDLEFVHLHTELRGVTASELVRHFRITNLFVGKDYRRLLDHQRVDYLPVFLSEVPGLFRSGNLPLDAALVHVSPPDAHGFCSLGTSVDGAKAAVETAKVVIAQVNSQMPRVHGDGFVHISKFAAWIEVNEELPEVPSKPLSDVALRIGEHVASLVENGSTLQAGIGQVPDACLAALRGHKYLGLHSEMWSDHALSLIESGAIDNSQKRVHPGKCVSTFVTGSRRLYEYIHDNPSVIQLEASYVNLPNVIARNPKVVAINSCVEIDLTGQVCADSIGSRVISGVGGQMDFMRAAVLSEGGKPIMAFSSRSEKGQARIVPQLKPGAGVVTTRAHVHWVVTEWGAANLAGLNLSQRARALTDLAHPEDRESLRRAWAHADF
jgi:4-hydroxybutyrate CoA-transferase